MELPDNKEQPVEEKEEEKVEPEIPFDSNKTYTIGIIVPDGIKVKEPEQTDKIKYVVSRNPRTTNRKGMFVNKGFYWGLFDEHYRWDTESDYSFEQYREDLVLSFRYNDVGLNMGDVRHCDYIFIPPIGAVLDSEFSKRLHSFLAKTEEKYPNACAYQIYMSESDRKKYRHLLDGDFIPDFPSISYRTFGGVLFRRIDLYAISQWTEQIWFKTRFDVYVQHLCEIRGSPIIVSKTNLINPAVDF